MDGVYVGGPLQVPRGCGSQELESVRGGNSVIEDGEGEVAMGLSWILLSSPQSWADSKQPFQNKIKKIYLDHIFFPLP